MLLRRARAASLCVAQSLNHNHCGAFRQDKTIVIGIEGAGCGGGNVVKPERKSPRRGETTDGDRTDTCFCPAAQRDIGLTRLDQPHGIADRLCRCRAGRHRRAGRAIKAEPDGDLSRREVRQK